MHGEEKLKEFIEHLNSSHDTIKFTSEHSRDSISFLDAQVILSEAMFTLLRIHFDPFSYRSVLPVHTAADTFENGMIMLKRSHCSAMDERETATAKKNFSNSTLPLILLRVVY